MWNVLKRTFANFQQDNCPRQAAALAYYTIFSMPPLLVVAITCASYIADTASFAEGGDARNYVIREARQSLGAGVAEQIDGIVERASQLPRSTWGTILGVGVLMFGASVVMLQLQAAVNEIWEVEPDESKEGMWYYVKYFLLKRVLSLAMVLAVGFLLLVSALVSTILAAVGDRMSNVLPEGIASGFPMFINGATDFLVALVLFAAMFRWLPDAKVAWRNAWIGALATAVLFIVGKSLLAIYFGRADVGSAYGAAGSLALLLVWIYYTGMIFLLGAEFTHALAQERGERIEPEPGAVVTPHPVAPQLKKH